MNQSQNELFENPQNELRRKRILTKSKIRKDVIKILKNSGHEAIFTPSYSPDFNPIENVFSVVKHYVKKATPQSKDELYHSIASSLSNLRHEILRNCFRHAFERNHYLLEYIGVMIKFVNDHLTNLEKSPIPLFLQQLVIKFSFNILI